MLSIMFLVGTLAAGEDPFDPPQELKDFASRHTLLWTGSRAKLEQLVRGFFAPAEEGGLGMTYDNSYTRTVREGYRDRKANCFTLTAMYISCCKSIGMEARYAESSQVSHWRRDGNIIRNERHVVAMMEYGLLREARVADFLPQVTRGARNLVPINSRRALALFHSNRAIELMGSARLEEALASARTAVEVDPSHVGGWNVLGVVQQGSGLAVEAEACFRRAMAVDPRDGMPYGNLETLLRSQGREEEAESCRGLAMELRKQDPYFNAFLANEALEARQWNEAETRVNMALKILPHEPEFHLLQARLSLALGQNKAAVKSLEQARKWTVLEDQPRWNAKIDLLKGHP